MPEKEKDITNDSAMENIRQFEGNWTSESGLSGLFNPLMSEQHEFYTMDRKEHFVGNLLCRDEAPVVTVTAFPVGSLSGISELNINIAYDFDLNGAIDHTLTIPNVAGACLNGAVLNCKPSGSWTGCEYGFFEFEGAQLKIPTEFPSGGPRPPHGLQECFCFNASCGATALVNMQKILNYFAIAVVNQLRELRPDVVVAKSDYDAGTMSLSYLGSKQSSCSGFADDAKVLGTTGLFGMLDFPYESEVATQEADPESVWSLVYKNATSAANTYTCTRQAKVTLNYEIIKADVYTKFGVGWDEDGSSQQCFWFSENGGCGGSLWETGRFDHCLDHVMGSRLGEICSALFVSTNYLLQITDVMNAQFISGPSNMVGCYGADNDSHDMLAEMTCVGKKSVEVPTCMSPSKLDWRQTTPIYNDDPHYMPEKYDGCWKIVPADDSCRTLAEQKGCRVKNVLSDGVYTVRNGVSTGVTPQASCKQFKGINNTFTVCEPWWREEYTYECDDELDWEKERQRAEAITQGINIGEDNKWLSQGDIGFNPDGSTFTRDLDAGILFQSKADVCEPACLVETEIPKNQMVLPEQGKVESDGSYHSGTGEKSTMPTGLRSLPEVLPCVEKSGVYSCPAKEGQVIKYDCTCANTQEFTRAISALSAIELASSDFICSSGEDQGVCSTDDLEGDYFRVICYKDEGMVDCSPALWNGNSVPAQTHALAVDGAYRCMVDNADADYDPDYTFGTVVPVKEWFDVKLPWARKEITDYLKDSGRLDEIASSCGCTDVSVSELCQPVGFNNNHRCIINSVIYSSKAACDTVCQGDATHAAGGGFCILSDPNDPRSGALFGIRYNIADAPMPEEEKVFGDVEISTGIAGLMLTGNMNESDMTCDDIPEQGDVRIDSISGSCSTPGNCSEVTEYGTCQITSSTKTTGTYTATATCSLRGENYTIYVSRFSVSYNSSMDQALAMCNANCYQKKYRCSTSQTLYNNSVICRQNCSYSRCSTPYANGGSCLQQNEYSSCYTTDGVIYSNSHIYLKYIICPLNNNIQQVTTPFVNSGSIEPQLTNAINACNASCYIPTYKCNTTQTVFGDSASCQQNCSGAASLYTNQSSCNANCKRQQMICEETGDVVQSQAECIKYTKDCYAGCREVDNGDGSSSRQCSSSCEKVNVGGVEKDICTGTCEDVSYNEGTRTDTITGTCTQSGSCSSFKVPGTCSYSSSNNVMGYIYRYTVYCNGSTIASIDSENLTCLNWFWNCDSEGSCFYDCSYGSRDFTSWYNNTCSTLCKVDNYSCNITGQTYSDAATCNTNCQHSTCSLTGSTSNGTTYANRDTCLSACKRTELHCAESNKLVQSAAECNVSQFECSVDNSLYPDSAACAQNCSFEAGGTLQYGSCADLTEDAPEPVKFSMWLTPTENADYGLDAKLAEIDALTDQETLIAQEAYGNEDIILNQCALRYVNPYIDFDEPGTMAHFEFAHMDQFIYRTAVAQGLLPAEPDKNVLPYIPPVYAGSKARKIDEAYMNQIEAADAETGLLPPLPEAAAELSRDPESQVPKRPMFWGKEIGTLWVQDESTRLGKYEVTATNLTPRVYYYECPDSLKLPSDTNTCMGVDPYGGVVPTIAGNWCFQYFCDANAVTEDTTTQISGCGMVNDGRWE